MAMYVQKGGCDVAISDSELQDLVLEAMAKSGKRQCLWAPSPPLSR